MKDEENWFIAEPVRIGTDRSDGQRCEYAENLYKYKYDLGHSFYNVVISVVEQLLS